MLLVTAAALLACSLRSLERVDPGFDANNVLVFRLDPRQNGYEGPRARNLLDTTLERLRRLPGVHSASFSSTGLIGSGSDVTVARPAGTPAPEQGSVEAPRFIAGHRAWRMVTDDAFLTTMGIRLRAGRTFTTADREGAPLVAVVNESLARQLFDRVEVIGERFMLGLGAAWISMLSEWGNLGLPPESLWDRQR